MDFAQMIDAYRAGQHGLVKGQVESKNWHIIFSLQMSQSNFDSSN